MTPKKYVFAKIFRCRTHQQGREAYQISSLPPANLFLFSILTLSYKKKEINSQGMSPQKGIKLVHRKRKNLEINGEKATEGHKLWHIIRCFIIYNSDKKNWTFTYWKQKDDANINTNQISKKHIACSRIKHIWTSNSTKVKPNI